MADIGVLDLQIKSSSGSAANNLGNLADALNKVKTAVSGGLSSNIEGVASALERIKTITSGGTGARAITNISNAIAKASQTLSSNNSASVFQRTANALSKMSDAYQKIAGGTTSSMQKSKQANKSIVDSMSAMKELEQQRKSFLEPIEKGFENSVPDTQSGVFKRIEELRERLEKPISYKNLADNINYRMGIGRNSNGVYDSQLLLENAERLNREYEETQNAVKNIKENLSDSTSSTRELQQTTSNWLESAIRLNRPIAEKYAQYPQRTLEDMFSGSYWRKNDDGTLSKYQRGNDLLSSWLNGNGTQKELDTGIETVAKSLGIGFDEAKQKVEEFRQSIQDATGDAEQLSETMGNAGGEGGKFSNFLQNFKEGIKNIEIPLSGLVKQFARIAKYRMLRAVLKQITEGFKEGIENVYRYSQAVGSSFAPAMDGISSVMAQFRNSIGAAAVPVLSAIIPVLNAIANAAIAAVNALNQLFSLLGGATSWTMAVPQTTSAFNDIKKSAGGAGGAIKELLADFDELNVITSQGGGGGGGGGAGGIDYANMFQDVFHFDQGIVDFVNWLKDNMESIKGIAIAIGTAIAAWRISQALADVLPLLSKLFGLIATGAVIAITLQLTWLFTNRYLETKDPGWLLADLLATAVGTTIAAAMVKKLLGGEAAAYTAAITLTLSAVVGMVALIQHTDVGAFSKEGILTALENALKVGAAGAILMHYVGGATIGQSLAGGAMIAVATFAFFVGLKAMLDPNIKLFSTQDILGAVAMALGIGGFTFLFSGGNLTWAGGAAIATFLVYFGIKAMLSKDVEIFSKESVIAAVAMGTGIGILSYLTTGSILFAGGAAVATVLVYFGVKAMLTKKGIEWGTIELTDEDVKKYVQKRMFRIDLDVSIERINSTIESTAMNKKKIESELSSLLGDLKVIKLGVSDVQDYTTIKKRVDEIITDVAAYASDEKNLAKLTLQFTPSLVGEGTLEQQDWFVSYTQGWDAVDAWFKAKGEELGKAFVLGENGEIIGGKDEVIASVLEQITDVMAAISGSKAKMDAFVDLNVGIGDLTEASATKVIDSYKTYIEKLREGLTASAKEAIAGQQSLVDFWFTVDPNGDEYKKAKKKLDKMIENLSESVEKSVQDAAGPGKDLIMQWIFANHTEGSIGTAWTDDYLNENVITSVQDTLEQLLMGGGVDPLEIDAMKLIGFTGFDLLQIELQKKIIQYASLRPETMEELKNNLKLSAHEVVIMSGWETFEEREKQKFINALLHVYGIDAASEIKDKIGDINVGDLIKISGWDNWEETEQKDYIQALKEIYGNNNVMAALLDLGENTPKWIAEGMNKRTELKNALTDIEKELKNAGIELVDILYNWDLTAGFIDDKNIEESVELIKTIVEICGEDSQYILENWGLIAPEVTGAPLETSLQQIKQTSQTLGVDIKTVINNWNLIAPSVTGVPLETSLQQIKQFSQSTGIEIQTVIQSWGLIAPSVTSIPLETSLSALKALATNTGIDIKILIENWGLIAPHIDPSNVNQSVSDITTAINNGEGEWKGILAQSLPTGKIEAPSDTEFNDKIAQVKKWAESELSGINPDIMVSADVQANVHAVVDTTVNVTANGGTLTSANPASASSNTTISAINPRFTTSSARQKLLDDLSKMAKATGAYGIPSGDLFIANENGPELVGTMAGKTTVANQNQIIEGISMGVAASNEEQNSLLREQNRLLQQILKKDSSVRIGASAALGRVARQSIEMYGNMTGG